MTNATFEEVTTELVTTEKLSLGGHTGVTGISDDYTENSTIKLPTSQALFNGLRKIQSQVDILNNVGLGIDNLVISTPLVSPVFNDTGYNYLGWELYNNVAIYTGDTVNNYIQLPHNLFSENHHYIFNIKVHILQSGRLELRDQDGDIIEVMSAIGDYYFEMTAGAAATFKLIAKDVEVGKTITISYLAIHQVSDQFYNYLTSKIRELSSVDGQGYVDKVLFETRMDAIELEFQTAISAMSDKIDNHLLDKENPHEVTYQQIGAAPVVHQHDEEYYVKEEINALISAAIATRALTSHTHINYVTESDVQVSIGIALDNALKSVHTVSPLSILEGPTGLLPELYTHCGITPPSQLLITNTFNHVSEGPYDVVSGYASTNISPEEGSKIEDAFMRYNLYQKCATFNHDVSVERVVIHYQFHRVRKLLGYVIRGLETGYISKWSLYTNFNTFVHSVTNASYTAGGYEVLLPVSQVCTSFAIEVIETSALRFGIHIEPIFDDITTGHIGVSEDPMLLSIPRSGNNLIFTLDLDVINDITPTLRIEGLPLYAYVEVGTLGNEQLKYTYIPPEFGTIRNGVSVFKDKFEIGVDIQSVSYDPMKYIPHKVFGTLKLKDVDTPTIPLINVYTGLDPWSINTNEATIEHTFITPTYMVGYDLEWDTDKKDKLPTTWTLKLYVVNESNEEELIVVDSVNIYGGKLNYNKSSILYCKDFKKAYLVKRYELYLNNENTTGLHISNFRPMISQDFYHVPKNTMYCGDTPVSKIYLGTATYLDGDFIVISQNVIGTTCHLPINNLVTTEHGYEYQILNPFHTTDVSCSVRYVDGDTAFAPTCSVVDMQDDVITVLAFSEHQFLLTIVRNW